MQPRTRTPIEVMDSLEGIQRGPGGAELRSGVPTHRQAQIELFEQRLAMTGATLSKSRRDELHREYCQVASRDGHHQADE